MQCISRALHIAVLGIYLLAPSSSAAESSPLPASNTAQSIDSVIAKRMEDAGIVGMGAAIVLNGKVRWTKGFGFADKANAVPFTPETVMNIGSISKTFTGVALMRAVQDGKLSLDADINAYLPFKVVNPHHPTLPITLRHLATHTSGIADHAAVYRNNYHFGGDAPVALGDFLKGYFVPGGQAYSRDNFLNVKPGTHREYSNIGAGLAGYIVENAVGEKLNTYTRRHIFTPLHMNSSGWLLSEIPAKKHAKLYVAHNGITIPIPHYGLTTYPDGGVRTSVADLSRFFIALLNNGSNGGAAILNPSSLQEMQRFQFTDANRPANVSLNKLNSGIFWATKMGGTLIGHGGSDPGLRTEMLANLSRDIAVILFTNTSLSDQEMPHSIAISNALWKHAEALKKEDMQVPGAGAAQ